MIARALSWVSLIPSPPSDGSTARLTILDLPFDVLEEILTYVLRPTTHSSPTASPSSRAGCLRVCKAFLSAGEKELYRAVRVSSKASWVALFGQQTTGLLASSSTRNVARFVHEIHVGRDTGWDWSSTRQVAPGELPAYVVGQTRSWAWGRERSRRKPLSPSVGPCLTHAFYLAGSAPLISSSVGPFPSLSKVVFRPDVLSHLSHRADPPTPLDVLAPQLLASNPDQALSLTLITHAAPHPSASDIASFLYLFTLPYPLASSTTNYQIVLPRHLGPIRETLHGALGLASPPPRLDTFHMDGCPMMESLRSRRTGHPFLVLAGSLPGWSFRRLVLSLPEALVEFDGADVYRRLFSMDTPSTPIPIPGGDKLERVELRVGSKREMRIREMWKRDAEQGKLSESGSRLAGMIWFVDGDEEGMEGSRRLVQVD